MLIANPLYDVVFKFLMEDNKSAKLLLGAILGVEIISLKFRPTESTVVADKVDENAPEEGQKIAISSYFQDFSAKIKTPEGNKLVILEVQMVNIATNSFRFRTYLGLQYGNKSNYQFIRDQKGKSRKQPVPIVNIFFLGHDLEYIKGIPVIKVEREYVDVLTGQKIHQRDPFIESLTHDCYVICVKALKDRQGSELEALLSFFDQSKMVDDPHFLQIDEKNVPAKYKPIMRRLNLATKDRQVLMEMLYQDAVQEEWQEYIQLQKDENNKYREKINKKIVEYDKMIEETEQKLADLKKQAAAMDEQAAAMAEQAAAMDEQAAAMAAAMEQQAAAMTAAMEQQAAAQKLELEQQKLAVEQQAKAAEQKAAEAEQQTLQVLMNAAKVMHERGLSIDLIASSLVVSIAQVKEWLEQVE
jgi:hypothetical protein